MKRYERKVKLNFSIFAFTPSEKNILVGHIFTLWPIIGKRQIFHNFFSKSVFDLDLSPTYGLNVSDIFFLKEHFIIYLMIHNLIFNYKNNLFALKNSKFLKKMLKIIKSKEL
jgi:hypothetical protein